MPHCDSPYRKLPVEHLTFALNVVVEYAESQFDVSVEVAEPVGMVIVGVATREPHDG
jgi:hypothetical protein